jgi:hypothetical protein
MRTVLTKRMYKTYYTKPNFYEVIPKGNSATNGESATEIFEASETVGKGTSDEKSSVVYINNAGDAEARSMRNAREINNRSSMANTSANTEDCNTEDRVENNASNSCPAFRLEAPVGCAPLDNVDHRLCTDLPGFTKLAPKIVVRILVYPGSQSWRRRLS